MRRFNSPVTRLHKHARGMYDDKTQVVDIFSIVSSLRVVFSGLRWWNYLCFPSFPILTERGQCKSAPALTIFSRAQQKRKAYVDWCHDVRHLVSGAVVTAKVKLSTVLNASFRGRSVYSGTILLSPGSIQHPYT